MKKVFIFIINIYRKFISPITPPSCRYYPTCSAYAVEALDKFGFLKGSYLTVRRVLRCHPFRKGGFDPVPDKFSITYSRIKK